MTKRIFLILMLIIFIRVFLYSGGFAEDTDVFIGTKPELTRSAASWGDFNNDSYWDLIVCGEDNAGSPKTFLYKNTGPPDYELVQLSHNFINVRQGDVVWFDYDNDGDVDLLIAGDDGSGARTKLYKNIGGGNFTDSNINLVNVQDCSISVGDYNNDGFLDIAIMGSYRGKIYRNTGGDFVDSGISIIPASHGDLQWVDLNNDGWLDIVQVGVKVVGGAEPLIEFSAVYKNTNGSFTEVNKLNNHTFGELQIADYDNDGDFDIALVGGVDWRGDINVGDKGKIYENISDTDTIKFSTNTFTPGVTESALGWGDVDNDGDIDLAVAGRAFEAPVERCNILKMPNFTTDISTITGGETFGGSATFVDYDNDRDLDLFICGQDKDGNLLGKLFKNNESDSDGQNNPNNIPLPVEDFNSRYFNEKLYIMWNDPPFDSDEETPADGFYYNFRVGSSSGIGDLVPARYGSPLLGNYLTKVTSSTIDDADIADGNVDVSGYKHVRVLNISGSSYYWAVQTIDTSLGFSWAASYGEGWSEQQVFKDTSPPTGLASTPTDEGERTYNKELTFSWTKGTADDPETGIFGCYIEVKEIAETGNETIVEEKELSEKLTKTVWDSAGNASYIHTGTLNKTYKIRVKARHGYDQSLPTTTYRPDIYGTSGDPDGLWHPDSPHYTGWTNWSDGIKIVELLTINNNLIRSPGSGGDAVEIGYSLIRDGPVIIRIFNILGELVKTVIDKYVIKGEEDIEKWYGLTDSNKIVASGVYYINIQAAGSKDTQKVVVVK